MGDKNVGTPAWIRTKDQLIKRTLIFPQLIDYQWLIFPEFPEFRHLLTN
jgi:hypothetical protein